MTIKLAGRYSEDNQNITTGEWSAEEITRFLENGHHGMLSFVHFPASYEVNGITCSASGLSIGDETFVFERDGKIVVPTFFRRWKIGMDGDPNEQVKVDVMIDPVKNPLYVTIIKD